jgi:hypothetical protein
MSEVQKHEQWWSFLGVLLLALILPGFLKLTNSVTRYFVGAEGRLAAVTVDTDRTLGPLPAVWQALAQGGDNLIDFANGITDKISAVKPEYIRIDHIYDEFGVVGRDNGGNLTYDWTDLDKTVKQITGVGAVPFFSLSYMPPVIASGDITSEPKNWDEWSQVVQRTIEHYSGEMNLTNVYYEVWNEPDLFGKWKMGGKKDYRVLYLYAANGASKASGVKPYKLGGPATTGLYKDWLNNFFQYVLANHLRLDFYSWHRYDLGLQKYAEDVKNVDQWIESQPYFSRVEKIVSEMGPNSEMGKENDTNVGAAHLVATARELMYDIKYGFNFAVSGKWGIVGKPRYEALAYLSKLGTSRLSVTGEGSWVSAIGAKNNNSYQVILVNYDPQGVHNEVVPVSFINLQQKKFVLTTRILGSQDLQTNEATTTGILQTSVPMAANSVALVELTPE